MKKQRYITSFIIIGLLAFIFLPKWFDESNLNPFDYARITAVDYTAEVVDEPDSDGKVIITERLTFDIHAASQDNLFWELWRDLPEEYIDGVKVDYKVNSVKQIMEDGTEVTYQESPKLYWDDYDYINTAGGLGSEKWYYSEGPYSEDLRQYECVLFYVDGLYREEAVFEIEYEMYNAALRYNDASELYLTPYSEDTIKFLKSFKGQLLFPNDKMPSKGNYDANTYGTNSHTFPFIESESINPGFYTFSFELDESQLKFKSYNQYIEFALVSYGEDKHIFTEYASKNDYYDDDVLSELRDEQEKYESLPQKYRIIKLIILLISLGCVFLTIVLVLNTNKRMKKKFIFYTSAMPTDYFRDIPSNLDPNFASTLVFCKHKPTDNIEDGYAAVMLSLVRKGYIELDKIRAERGWDFNNVNIIVKYRPSQEQITVSLEPLTLTEGQYYNLIVRHALGTEITMASFQKKVSSDFEHTNAFAKNIKNAITTIGISQGYFQKADYKQPRKHLRNWFLTLGIMGVLLITVGNLILSQTRLDLAFGSFFIIGIGFIAVALQLNKISKKYILLTQYGEDEYAKWRGLYNFLNSETLMKERTVIELVLWEQYLIYATAFGISEKVIKALKIRCPEADMSPVLRNPYFRSRSFHSSGRSFRSATRTASFTSRSGSFGGGYGGGGRGGGGGGGGH